MNADKQTATLTTLIQPRYPSGHVVLLGTGEFAIQAGMLWPQWPKWEAWQQHLVVGRTYSEAKQTIATLLVSIPYRVHCSLRLSSLRRFFSYFSCFNPLQGALFVATVTIISLAPMPA